MASISLRKIEKRFGGVSIIPDLSLDIADEEFVVLVGPSGCGKSTLLRILAGLERVDGGDLFIGETRVNDLPAARRDIAMVFQDYALYPHMTVRQNMAFALEMRGATKAEIVERIAKAARLLDIEPYLDRRPKALSGGQRQRVAMGRAIVRDPKVFLFDEPLSNLDAKLRAQVRVEIKALHDELRTTMVFVTHDQVEAMTMADRIVVMKSGVIQQVGAPEDVYERPANLFVAGFIGSPSMNVLPVKRAAEGLALADGTRVPGVAAPAGGDDILLGVRPEHFATDAPDGIVTTITLVEPLGSDTLVHASLAGTPVIARVAPDLRPKPGDTVRLAPAPAKAHLFAASSGAIVR